MLDAVQQFEFYYDSSHPDPREDPEELRRRLRSIADDAAIDLETTDTAEKGTQWRRNRHRELRRQLDSDRSYRADNRVFAGDIFGGLRPVLVLRYDSDHSPDVYPHQNDSIDTIPIRIADFLAEVVNDSQSPRGDFARVHPERGREETSTDVREPEREQQSSSPFLSTVRQRIPVLG
jgi:hypothetical protein